MGGIVLKNVDALEARLKTLAPADKITELNILAHRAINPYITIAVILVAFAIVIAFIKLPEIKQAEDADNSLSIAKKSIFQFPHLLLGAFAIFFYVGAEVISYDTFAGFGNQLGYSTETASKFAQYTAYGLLLGYVLSIICIPKFISQRKALIGMSILSILLVIFAINLKGIAAIACFATLGFSQAVMWPAIWPLAIDGLGRFTKIGAALLIMGIVGGALFPWLYGKLAEAIGSRQTGYWIMIPLYLYILFYALKGYKVGLKNVDAVQ
jgi:fucose permease